MERFDLLRYVAQVIEQMGLPYFVTGSTATIFYGEPRMTNDVDIVVRLPSHRVHEFCEHFPPADFHLSESAALDAVLRRSQFNIIHPGTGLKADLIVPEPTAFNDSRFARARHARVRADYEAVLASREDVIIKKMEYYREGGSEKHLRDIAGVLQASQQDVDSAYIAKWSEQLGLADVWAEILRQTGFQPS